MKKYVLILLQKRKKYIKKKRVICENKNSLATIDHYLMGKKTWCKAICTAVFHCPFLQVYLS
jgi:hypothetical protein